MLSLVVAVAQTALAQTGHGRTPAFTTGASSPQYVPNSYYSNPLSDSPWISPRQVIKLPQAISFGPNTAVLTVTDTTTGRETPLDRINAVIREMEGVLPDGRLRVDAAGRPVGMPFNPCCTSLSPDGRWLLWPSRTNGQPTWTAMSLDGAASRVWPRHTADDGSSGKSGWMRDNEHWVEVSQRLVDQQWRFSVSVYSLDTPRVLEYPLDLPGSISLLPCSDSKVSFTGDGCAWIMGDFGKRYELVPGPEAWVLREEPILTKIAAGRRAWDPALSPSGNWLVWRETEAGSTRSRLRIGRPDGSEALTVFEADGPIAAGSSYRAQWTPDEQSLAFHWRGDSRIANAPNGDGLYTISLRPLHARLPHSARRLVLLGRKRGPFPTAAGQSWTTRVAETTRGTALR